MTTQKPSRTTHPYHMHDAILGQPKAIARVLDSQQEAVHNLGERLVKAKRVYIVGIGTSWHASLVGEYLLRTVADREEAQAWNSFEFCAHPPPLNDEALVIVMSHRGSKQVSAQALALSKKRGAVTAVVTGQDSAAREDLADSVIRTCPQEKSAAFTISHTTAMTALMMLAAEVGATAGQPEAKELSKSLQKLPQWVEETLDVEPQVRRVAQRYRDEKWFHFLGWGPNIATAYEAALKMKEANYTVTEGFQIEYYLHGPFVATGPGFLVTLIAPPGAGEKRAKDIAKAAKEIGAKVLAIAQKEDAGLSSIADDLLAMPPVQEPLSPIIYLVPLQLFTYWLAVELGCNPDTFRWDNPRYHAARQHYLPI
ncbi:MAG: SIS domain-containing protein [Dehalococcoidia bacterium]